MSSNDLQGWVSVQTPQSGSNPPGQNETPVSDESSPRGLKPPGNDGHDNNVMSFLKLMKTDMDDGFDKLNKRMDKAEKTAGFLIEDKGRTAARRLFGDDFGETYVIKSIHDVVSLLAKANDKGLPKRDMEKRVDAANKVAEVLEPYQLSFLKSAARVVLEQSQDTVFENAKFEKPKQTINDNVRGILAASEVRGLQTNIGQVLDAVKKMSTTDLPGDVDDPDAKKGRAKMMTGRFQLKLERMSEVAKLKAGALTGCSGPGILFCCALVSVYKKHMVAGRDRGLSLDEPKIKIWIENECNIFDYQPEIECDAQGKVELSTPYATIQRGEIKTSMEEYGCAREQMTQQANLIEFAIRVIFPGTFTAFIKMGHLLVYEGKDGDQRWDSQVYSADNADDDEGISVFVHSIK